MSVISIISMRGRTAIFAIAALSAILAAGCATPVGVAHLDRQAAHRELGANILSTGKPSQYSTQILTGSRAPDVQTDGQRRLMPSRYSSGNRFQTDSNIIVLDVG
jgi:hypothetical protein